MHETAPQPAHRRTSNAREALTHAAGAVRMACVGIASAAHLPYSELLGRAPQCMLRAAPCKTTKASGCSFTAFSQVEKEGSHTQVALQIYMGRRHSGRARGCRPGRAAARRAGAGLCRALAGLGALGDGVGACWERCLAGGAGGALQGQAVHQQAKQQSWIPMEVPLLWSSVFIETPNPCDLYPFRHN